MTAYIIFTRERIHDEAEMKTYAAKAGPTLGSHPGKPLAFYGPIVTLEGPEADGAVIIEFPDREAALAWYNSPDYMDARKHRFLGSDYRVFVVDGMR
jgi:uncharacterized protein (DUF1330 family)